MAQYIDKSAVVAEIEKIISDDTESIKSFEHNKNASEVQRSNARIGVLTYLRSLLDTLEVKEVQEEPVSNDLGKAAEQDVCEVINTCSEAGIPNDQIPSWVQDAMINEFIHGAKWQAENLWKPADGDDLPEIDREVIALLDNGKVVYAHRPSAYWDGKNIDTGKVTRYYPKTYDKGGWNIPNVKYWLDCSIPKEIEL